MSQIPRDQVSAYLKTMGEIYSFFKNDMLYGSLVKEMNVVLASLLDEYDRLYKYAPRLIICLNKHMATKLI